MIKQLALGHYPSSVITAFIGILTGQLYRSDLANLKTYRLPPSIVRVSEKLLLPLVGNLRPPPRALIALPDATPATSTPPAGASESTPDPASGAPAPPPTGTSPVDGPATQAADTPTNGTGLASGSTSVMREWVDELTGRTQNAAAGLRVPPEAEIAQVMAMFPDMDRSVVVAALQRRCVTRPLSAVVYNPVRVMHNRAARPGILMMPGFPAALMRSRRWRRC